MNQTIDTTALLTNLEDQTEQHLALAIRRYQNLSEEILSRRPTDGGWSITECLWHLNSYSRYYLPEIKKALAKGTTPTSTFTSTWLGAYFTRIMKPGPGMKKMKAFKDHRPPSEIVPHEVVAEFIHQQEELLGLLRKARMANLAQIKIGISILPWLKLRLGDVFQFLIAHQDRHIQQAERIQAEMV